MSPRRPATPDQGKAGDPEKDQVEATDAKQAAAVEAASEDAPAPKPKRARRKATPKAKDTAAETTGVDKEVAEAAVEEPAEPVAAAAETAEEAPAEEKPKPRRTRRKAADETPPEPVAAPKRAASVTADGPPVVRAHAKYVRTSARKARLVCDHIRGKSVPEARAILAHASRDVARDWSKLLESAVANAEHNHELIGDELRIQSVKADEGPTLKRFRPRAMGRATKIRKRTSHLSITLTPKDGDN
jgi:large subunit ribosomal protein L22